MQKMHFFYSISVHISSELPVKGGLKSARCLDSNSSELRGLNCCKICLTLQLRAAGKGGSEVRAVSWF